MGDFLILFIGGGILVGIIYILYKRKMKYNQKKKEEQTNEETPPQKTEE